MTIREIHQAWGHRASNIIFFNRTRGVFERVFAGIDLDRASSLFTLRELQECVAMSDVFYEDKVKAASVMEHLFRYAADTWPNQQEPIRWDYNDLLKLTNVNGNVNVNDNVNDNVNGNDVRCKREDVRNISHQTSAVRHQTTDNVNDNVNDNVDDNDNVNDNVNGQRTTEVDASGITEIRNSKNTKNREQKPKKKTKTKTKTEMNERKNYAKPTPVAQIDPKTGAVIKVYESIVQAEKAVGTHNIRRAIQRGGTAGGSKWKVVEEVQQTPEPFVIEKETLNKTVENIRKLHLTKYTDQELIDEMIRRGWRGSIEYTVHYDFGV